MTIGNVPSPNAPLKRVLAYTGCFSRMQTIKEIHEYLSQRLRIKEEDMRLWLYNSEVRGISVMKSTNSVLNPYFMSMGLLSTVIMLKVIPKISVKMSTFKLLCAYM